MANSPRLAELADLITRREYNYAICRARKHEEDLVRRYAKDHDVEYTSLADTIEELYQTEVIDDASRENLHMIRHLGNKAVHEGDNDAADAKAAYDLLKRELTTYSDQKYMNPERTPVALGRNNGDEEYDIRRRVRERENRDRGGLEYENSDDGRRRSGGRRPERDDRYDNGGRKPEGNGLYTVLKVLIPVLIIVLLVVLIKSIFDGRKTTGPETTPATVIETEAPTTEAPTTEAPTTEAPTTEAPTTEAPVTYQIKGDGVNVRYASDPSRIYTKLSNKTFIGPVTDYENTTGDSTYDGFARFTYDGQDVIVKKDFIEKTNANQ